MGDLGLHQHTAKEGAFDVEEVLSQLSTDDKIALLSGLSLVNIS